MQLLHWKKTKVFLKKFSLERSFVESGRRPASWIYGGLLRHQHLLVKHLLLLKGMTSMNFSVSVGFSEKGGLKNCGTCTIHTFYNIYFSFDSRKIKYCWLENLILLHQFGIDYWSNCLFYPFITWKVTIS